MKKSVLIVASDMEIGGAERALLGLLDAFNTNNYQVDLFLMRHTGSFLTLIPSKINIIPENKKFSCLAVPIQQVIKKKCFGVAFGRLIGKIKAKLHLRKNHVTVQNSVESLYSFKYTMRFLPMISDKYYDLAIGFTTPYYVVEKKSLAKTKIVWIHTDYTKEYSDTINEERVWSVYDKIVGVSDAVCESFASKYPGIKDKIIEMDNIVSVPIIWNQANDFSAVEEMPEDGSVRLLSIGRFCYAKNFDSIPFICRYLLEKGIGVKWYLIGFGSDEQLIRDNISKANVESNVIILGKRDNPYPYIKACDIYVQPSRFEGRCVTVTEAQILNKPVIITDYATSSSQLEDGYDGIIVSMDNEGCARGIERVIRDKQLRDTLIAHTKNYDYSNMNEIEKIYQLV